MSGNFGSWRVSKVTRMRKCNERLEVTMAVVTGDLVCDKVVKSGINDQVKRQGDHDLSQSRSRVVGVHRGIVCGCQRSLVVLPGQMTMRPHSGGKRWSGTYIKPGVVELIRACRNNICLSGQEGRTCMTRRISSGTCTASPCVQGSARLAVSAWVWGEPTVHVSVRRWRLDLKH